MNDESNAFDISDSDIAIVGMAAHLPGAADINAYWANLAAGVESIRHLTEEELLAAGESPARMRKSNYVPSAAVLDGFEQFDADFFGFSPKEAAILDPQHRQFLEVAWEAMENAGHPPENFKGPVGVYAGCGMGSYFYFNICSNRDLVDQTGMFLLRHTGNDKDFLSTRVSHIFDLKGPSINLQTACSTSLVAVHFATQALLNGECDMALAGGVTIELPQGRGYLFTEGEILSPDGHCHAFDHRAEGTVFGSGAGCVVLRRAADAVRDGDHIWAIIKGSAVNNDGAAKAGYLAPSVDGQAKCIAEAQAMAGVSAADVSYVECHGTGTYLGDPIEVAALTEAFRKTTDAIGSCRLGSVKTNIGHCDTAAGVASLIKVALSLHHRKLPPSLGYEAPNPSIDFETSPFKVNDKLTEWASKGPLRAGVNSLGVGGTNAHVVLQEAPKRVDSEESLWPFQPIVISAKSKGALENAAQHLAQHLRSNPGQDLADVAYTLKEGRRAFERRRVLVAADHAEAANLLDGSDPRRVFNHDYLGDNPEVVFMFPGGGAQYAGMARDIYATEPVFADWMDQGLAILQPKLDYDIRALWLPEKANEQAANDRLKRPSVQLPLIMIIEYALAQLYMSWGVQPAALVGHSMGENTAACLAGVFSFEDCISLIHLRGTLFDTIAPGGMLSVPLAEADLRPYIIGDLDLASVNAPGLCVVSGPDAALLALAAELTKQDIETQRIQIDIAAHSRMLEPILTRFGDFLRSISLHAPQLPIISNRSGMTLTAAEATSPDYWVQHLRNTVNFQACMATLMAKPGRVYMEMGPGRAMSSLAQANGVGQACVIPALRHPEQKIFDDAWHVASIARLWACGVAVDWEPIWGGAKRNRVVLPTYAFQRKPYFIEPGKGAEIDAAALPAHIDDMANWGWKPHWRPAATGFDYDADFKDAPPESWLIFLDTEGLGAECAARLRAVNHPVITVRAADTFGRDEEGGYTLAPERGREGYDMLFRDLVATGHTPTRIAHFWLVTRGETFRPGSSFFHRNLEQGFYSLMFLAQAITDENLARPIHLSVITTGAAQVKSEALNHPEKSTILGPMRVIPRELPGVTVATLDLILPTAPRRGQAPLGAISAQVLEDLMAEPECRIAALRGEKRYEQGLKAALLPDQPLTMPQGAHVLITGGFGGIGLTVAEDLIRQFGAKITLIARRNLPERGTWAKYLGSHDPNSPIARRILALQRLEALGGEIMVAPADVCNMEDMRAAVDAGVKRFGPVRAVIHAAGVVDDGPLMIKTPAQVEEVFAPKLHGTLVLDRLFPDGSIDLMVLFSSTSTVTGPAGQIDYVAANEFLNAFAKSRSAGKTRVVALNWGIWTGVGMAAEALADRTGALPAPALPISAAMLNEASFDPKGNRIFTADYGIDRWVLDGHRTKSGQALIPGTGYIEVAAEALRAQGETGAFELRDLYFLRPLDVANGEVRPIRARLTRSDEGYGFDLRSAATVKGRMGWQLHATARAVPVTIKPLKIDVLAIVARLPAAEIGTGLASPQEQHLNFGARWRVLQSRSIGDKEGLARLTLPAAFASEAGEYLLHPALMDLATGWAMGLIAGYRPDHLWVPVSYAKIRVLRPLPADIMSWVRSADDNRATNQTASFDVTLATLEGEVCVEIEGFSIHKLEGELSFSKPDARDLEFDDQAAKPTSPAEERLLHSFSLGIKPTEGAQAFARAVQAGGSQIIVSSLDLPALIRQTADADAAKTIGKSFDRPDLDTAYVEPRTDVERTLTGFWQELLGVAQVGVEDSFFDLGGHSLIAVRLFAMVKKAYRVDFPISILFEAPTIARCAALITDQIGDFSSAAPAKIAAPTRRFTHLVPMHQGEGGAKQPFFLCAGMFGNVLNLRHLAQLIGGDRPFYGLQARGLYGDAAPHTNFVDAAGDCIAELRQVQPHGPYMLGGFSGGGLNAWDMARQLEAEGEVVSLVVLLDTPVPMLPPIKPADKALIKLAEIRSGGVGFVTKWLTDKWNWHRQKRNPAPSQAQDTQFNNAAIEAAFRTALPQFDMVQRAGATVLFRPALDRHWAVTRGNFVSKGKQYVFPDNNLTQFAPGLQVVEVPGDHDSMVLEPNVRVLAAKLRAVIAQAESNPSNVVTMATAAE
jgi:acyl transferase domain-containing protein/thioesterase domain-containing protein/NAD(P)-dependent dehydrogenase (short-subunit alcohol dehydrogenase family)/acyl carrier protein